MTTDVIVSVANPLHCRCAPAYGSEESADAQHGLEPGTNRENGRNSFAVGLALRAGCGGRFSSPQMTPDRRAS
jgi:hypothetical protein